MNKKIVIIGCIVLALCGCVVVAAGLFIIARTPQTISNVQSGLKDTQRRDFLNRVNLDVNQVYAQNAAYPTVQADATSPFLVKINGDILENLEDTSANLSKDFCYGTSAKKNQYSLKLKLTDGSVLSLGNIETLCTL